MLPGICILHTRYLVYICNVSPVSLGKPSERELDVDVAPCIDRQVTTKREPEEVLRVAQTTSNTLVRKRSTTMVGTCCCQEPIYGMRHHPECNCIPVRSTSGLSALHIHAAAVPTGEARQEEAAGGDTESRLQHGVRGRNGQHSTARCCATAAGTVAPVSSVPPSVPPSHPPTRGCIPARFRF